MNAADNLNFVGACVTDSLFHATVIDVGPRNRKSPGSTMSRAMVDIPLGFYLQTTTRLGLLFYLVGPNYTSFWSRVNPQPPLLGGKACYATERDLSSANVRLVANG